MTNNSKSLRTRSSGREIENFLQQAKALTPRSDDNCGRLLFALDATASRESVWDRATSIQSEMFLEASRIGNLEIMLAYYRGFMECHKLRWSQNAAELLHNMSGIRCAAGVTQITRILRLALDEHAAAKINAVVFVGDCMEEDCDKLTGLAGRLGILGVPVFVFQDGFDAVAEKTFREIARISKGAWSRFDAASAAQLRDLLCGVAVYAAGGADALHAFSRNRGDSLKRLTQQLKR